MSNCTQHVYISTYTKYGYNHVYRLNHTYSVAEVGPTQSDYTYSEITKRIEPDTSALNNPAGYIYSTVDKKRNKDSTKCVYSSADNIAVVSDQ